MGRLTKYKPEYCEELVDHMTDGLSFESFGGKIGVTEHTLFNWEKKHKKFLQSHKKGTLKCLLHWEEMGHDMALTGQGSPVMWIFNMKNRFRKQGWSDKSEIDHTTNGKDLPTPIFNGQSTK